MTELSCVVTNKASSHLVHRRVLGSNLHNVEVEENASATHVHSAQLIQRHPQLSYLDKENSMKSVGSFELYL